MFLTPENLARSEDVFRGPLEILETFNLVHLRKYNLDMVGAKVSCLCFLYRTQGFIYMPFRKQLQVDSLCCLVGVADRLAGKCNATITKELVRAKQVRPAERLRQATIFGIIAYVDGGRATNICFVIQSYMVENTQCLRPTS